MNNKLYKLTLILTAFFTCARSESTLSDNYFANTYTHHTQFITEKLRDTIKQLVTRYYDAHEPSPEISMLVHEALQNLGITQEIIVLESNTLTTHARALRLPYIFLIISSFKEQEASNEKTYALYRALADVYYDHGGTNRAKLLVPSILLSLINLALGKKIDALGSTAIQSCNMGVVSALVLSIMAVIGDCVEANQESIELACTQLIKNKKVDVIEQELLTKRPTALFESDSQLRRKILAQCLYDTKQTGSLQRVLTQAKSVYDIELMRILKKMGTKSVSTIPTPTKGRAPLPRFV